MNATDAYALGADLVSELAEHLGDPDAVGRVFREWGDDLEDDLPLVAMGALWHVMLECLSVVDSVPPGSTRFQTAAPPDPTETDRTDNREAPTHEPA